MTPETLQQVATVAGAVLTILIFSYLLGDNFLYRIAIHVLIGAAAGYILLVAIESVLIPWVNATILAQPTDSPRLAVGLIPFLIGLLLFFKSSPRFSRLGDLGFVVVLGVGTALSLWGAVSGTLLPLVSSTARGLRPENVIDGLIVLIGVVSVLVYFTYVGVRRSSGEVRKFLPIRAIGIVGKAFIVITLGATYALLIITALTVLSGVISERLLVLIPGG